MRVRRLLLFILVAVNLTLVCQGHAAERGPERGHTGVHLALLGEPHPEDDAGDAPDSPPHVSYEPGHVAVEDASAANATRVLVDEVGRNSDPALLGASHLSSLSTLAVALLSSLAGAARTFSMRFSTPLAWTSHFRKPPEPPPPQAHV